MEQNQNHRMQSNSTWKLKESYSLCRITLFFPPEKSKTVRACGREGNGEAKTQTSPFFTDQLNTHRHTQIHTQAHRKT